MTLEKLDLLEFATGQVTEPGARAAQVVRRQLLDADMRGRCLDDMPEHLRRHPVAPDSPGFVDRAEDAALGNGGGCRPLVDCGFNPLWDPHHPVMTTLADQIGDDPGELTANTISVRVAKSQY